MKLTDPTDLASPSPELQAMFDHIVEQLAPTRSAILIVVRRTSEKGMQAQLLSALPPALTAFILQDLVKVEVERMKAELAAIPPTTTH